MKFRFALVGLDEFDMLYNVVGVTADPVANPLTFDYNCSMNDFYGLRDFLRNRGLTCIGQVVDGEVQPLPPPEE